MLMRLTATAGERLFENLALVNLRHVEKSPAARALPRRAATSMELIHQKPGDALLDSVVMRLDDTRSIVVSNLNQMLVGNRVPELLVHWKINSRTKRVRRGEGQAPKAADDHW